MAVLRQLFDIRSEEVPRFSLLFAAFFIFNVGMAWADSNTRAVLTSPELGERDWLAIGQVFYGIITIITSIAYTAVVDRVPKHRLLVIMTGLAAGAVALGIGALFTGLFIIGAVALYVLQEAILLIWVLQWKTNIIDFYDTRTSKRILPLLGASRLIGLSIGGFSYRPLTTTFGLNTDGIFILWFASLIGVLVLMWSIPRLLNDPKPEPTETQGGYLDSIRDGVSYIANSNYLKWMTVSALLMNAIVSLFILISTNLVSDYYAANLPLDQVEEATGAFFGDVRGVASLIMLVVQLFFFPSIMKRFGLGNVNLIYPIVTFGMAGAVALATLNVFTPVVMLGVAGLTQVSVKSFRRVFRSPINGLLINAVPSYMKGRARSVINGLISPVANIAIGLIVQIQVINLFGAQIDSTQIFVVVTLVVALGYLITGFILRRQYTQALLNLLESNDYAALLNQEYDLGVVDRGTLEQLNQQLHNSDDPDFHQFIATLMLEIGADDAITLVTNFAHGTSDESRERLMETLYELDIRGSIMRQFYVTYIRDDNPAIRRLAMLGLLQVTPLEAAARASFAEDHLHDIDVVVRAAMCRALLETNDYILQDRGERALKVMFSDARPEARVAAVDALIGLGDTKYLRQLIIRMEDDNDDVRYRATQGIELMWRDDLPQETIDLLLKRENMLLDDPVEHIRQAELSILSKIQSPRAIEGLILALADPSKAVRQSAVDALVRLHDTSEAPLLATWQSENRELARGAVQALARINHREYNDELLLTTRETLNTVYANTNRIVTLSTCEAPSFEVLRDHFAIQNVRLLDDVFTMLDTLHDERDIATIRETLQSDTARIRINAVEALEALIAPDIARRIAPLFDPNSTFATLAQRNLDAGFEPFTLQAVIDEIISTENTWLHAVCIVGLGEIGANYAGLREQFHIEGDPTEANPCHDSIDPAWAGPVIRFALYDEDPELKFAGQAAMRLLRHEAILDSKRKDNTIMLTTIERMIYLKHVPFFRQLPTDQLKAIANICQEEVFKKDELVFGAGDNGGTIYVVISGNIEIGIRNPEGDGTAFVGLATYGANTTFGEMSLFDGRERSADAIAREETLTLSLQREPFLALVRQYPDLSANFITLLSERLRHANQQIAELDRSLATRHNL